MHRLFVFFFHCGVTVCSSPATDPDAKWWLARPAVAQDIQLTINVEDCADVDDLIDSVHILYQSKTPSTGEAKGKETDRRGCVPTILSYTDLETKQPVTLWSRHSQLSMEGLWDHVRSQLLAPTSANLCMAFEQPLSCM